MDKFQWEDPATDLSAVTSTGAGDGVTAPFAEQVRVVITAASVTTGGTVLVQGNTKADGSGTWFTVNTTAVSADGDTRVELDANDIFPLMRTNLSARTDGTYTTSIARRR